MSRLADRQATTDRPGDYVMGGFDDDGREVVKKTYSSGKAAEKPSFFMGGCGPVVPTGPKRKLRTSWMANAPAEKEELPPIPKPTKRWTPPGGVTKKALPNRASTHDGTISMAGGGVKKGKKPEHKEEEEEKKEKDEPAPAAEPAPVPEEKEEVKAPEPVKEEVKKVTPAVKKAEPVATKKEEKPAWTPPVLHIRKPIKPTTDECKKHMETKEEETPAPAAVTSDGKCAACPTKDELIKKQEEEIATLKAEKGELAKEIKKIKGSAKMNKELKDEIFQLKQELKKKDNQAANSKAFHTLENKLNTLKMMMDGKVNKNSLEDLKEHVDMLNMILNQDLKKDGMKNVWA